jgi:hypothetical protein
MLCLAFVGAALLLGPAESAWAACNPGRGIGDPYPYFAGWYRTAVSVPTGTLGYVESQIEEYSPYVAPVDGNETVSAWVMIEAESDYSDRSQVGWLKYATGKRWSFSEWTYDNLGNWTRQHYTPQPVGNYTVYEVYWDPNTERLQHWINANLVVSHMRHFTMRRANNHGETHNQGSQMPGGFDDHEQFTFSYVGDLSDNLYAFNGTLEVDEPDWHGAAEATPTGFHIWDRACQT